MNHLKNIIKKEVKELLTPGSVISVLLMVILFACLGGLIGSEVEKSTALPIVAIGNYEAETVDTPSGEWNAYDSLRQLYVSSGVSEADIDRYIIRIAGTSEEEIFSDLTESEASFALVMDANFKENIESGMKGIVSTYYIYTPTGMIGGTVSSAVSSALIQSLNNDLSSHLGTAEERMDAYFLISPISGSDTHTYINGNWYKDVTPSDIANTMSGQTMLIPIIIMIIIMMVGSIVISSMGSEKENKTLETLLTLPIKRTTIVTGKIIAAAIVGLVFGLAYMVGMGFYIGSITNIQPSGTSATGVINLADYGLSLGIQDYGLIGVSIFLSIACALGICMILGAFAKNYKSAQTMTMPLSILAIIPMFIIMFSGWYGSNIVIKGILFVIPFSHPMMATEALMNGDVMLVLLGILYMAIFAIVTILITVKLYKSDILITGLSQNKYIEALKGNKKRHARK